MPSRVWVGGMRMSMMATSGWLSSTARTSDGALPACATTSTPARWRSSASAWRIKAASSARTRRSGMGKLPFGLRPGDWEISREDGRPAGRAYQCDAAAERVRAVVKTLESRAPADGRSADAVVGDGELECLWCPGQRYLHLMGTGVLGGVRRGLGGDVVRGGLDGGIQPSDVCCFHLDWCRRPARERPQGGDEPSFRQLRGMDSMGQALEFCDGFAQVGVCGLEEPRGLIGRGREQAAGVFQSHSDGDELLLRAVVEVAFDPPASLVCRLGDTSAGCL